MAFKKAPLFGKKPMPMVTGPSPSTKDPGAAKSKRKSAKPTGGQASMTTAQSTMGTGAGMKAGSKPGAKPW
jgi:hypothetical protein